MTQNELWLTKYQEVMDFIEANHRNPSKHYLEEKLMHHWVHHNRKLMNTGTMKENRVEMFEKLFAFGEQYKHVNQYQ